LFLKSSVTGVSRCFRSPSPDLNLARFRWPFLLPHWHRRQLHAILGHFTPGSGQSAIQAGVHYTAICFKICLDSRTCYVLLLADGTPARFQCIYSIISERFTTLGAGNPIPTSSKHYPRPAGENLISVKGRNFSFFHCIHSGSALPWRTALSFPLVLRVKESIPRPGLDVA